MMPSNRSGKLLGVLLGASLLSSAAFAIVDLGDGVSAIWKLAYGVSSVSSNADSDGDGLSDAQEAITGTNPFVSSNTLAITRLTVSNNTATIFWPSIAGKRYIVQSNGDLNSTNWANETTLLVGTGSTMSSPVAMGAGPKWFRVAVQDVDTDGDGVTDWEELRVGYNIATNATFGGTNDLQSITAALQSTNVVNAAPRNPYADMDGPVSGTIQITRAGNLNAITVPFALSGTATSGVDFVSVPTSVAFPLGTNSVTVTIKPVSNSVALVSKLLTLTIQTNAAYGIGASTNASIVIDPLPQTNGTGLFGQYFDNGHTNYANATNFTGFVFSRVDTNINFNWGSTGPTNISGTTTNILGADTFTIRWTGQVQPEFSETYYFFDFADDGVKLWVNGTNIIDRWAAAVRATTGSVALVGGMLYDIKLEYVENTGNASNSLYWWSNSQTKQIIPTTRLYPNTNAAANVTSDKSWVGLIGGPFNYQITGSNLPFIYGATGLPPGLSINPATGQITGTPTVPGNYKVTLSVTNGRGTGYAILDLTIIDTGGSISRDYWTGITGDSVTNIPLDTAPTGTDTLTSLAVTNFGNNYGERIRGYLTPPVTGNYYFWLTATNSAELWISNDGEQVNSLRRCSATNNTTQSPWLALTAGQKYYVEILHKAGAISNDAVTVQWLRPDQTSTGVVPGYVLSLYVPPSTNSLPGTLYTANMLASPGVNSTAVGTATLRVSPDGTQATLRFSLNNLTNNITAEHIDGDPYLNFPAVQELFDISIAHPQADGSYLWKIKAVSPLGAADILEMIVEGKVSIVIDTSFAAAELSGHFTLADGTRTFTPPPEPPPWTDDHATTNGAVRFLTQTTFGANSNDIASVLAIGFNGWINDQFAKPVGYHLPYVLTNATSDPTSPYPSSNVYNSWWQQSVTAPDQLRQRVAFALSEIMVVSDVGVLNNYGRALSDYYDMLLDNAFGNFRQLIENVTLHPAMGLYLDMRANDKGDLALGRSPNENYAREIQQLFSIGLYRLWPDGSLVLDSTESLVPTYDQSVVQGYARVFTGWNYNQTNSGGRLPTGFSPAADYTNPMTLVPTRHELGTKRILDNVVLPAALGDQLDQSKVAYDTYGGQDLAAALDAIFYNPNVGPFICRQLIQRLVTSSPSRDYLYRVVQKFNDDGTGVRGNMQAVIKAILLDYEARDASMITHPTFGKQREPLLRATALARAFPSPVPVSGTYSQSGNQVITVTTATPHRLATGNTMFLNFTSGSPVPTSTGYSITTAGSLSFTVQATGVLTGSYTQVTNAITVKTVTHGLILSNHVHITFTTGGASNMLYELTGVPTTSSFIVPTPDTNTISGLCMIAFNTGGYIQIGSNTTVSTTGNHGLNVGDTVNIDFLSGNNPDGQYQVTSVIDEDHYVVYIPKTGSQTQYSLVCAPVAGPPLIRSGNVSVMASTWNMNDTTDNSLTQTPLHSTTVFNFFLPDFKFPGILASAGLTTPEFQLTSDSNVANQDNFLAGGIINNQGSNTNGINSFKSGSGAIVMDFGPWMTTNYTSAAGIPTLVDTLNAALLAGQLPFAAKTSIVAYVTNTTNIAYSNPPTQSQIRDRVRAVIHLLVTSPSYTIQK